MEFGPIIKYLGDLLQIFANDKASLVFKSFYSGHLTKFVLKDLDIFSFYILF